MNAVARKMLQRIGADDIEQESCEFWPIGHVLEIRGRDYVFDSYTSIFDASRGSKMSKYQSSTPTCVCKLEEEECQ